MTGFDGRAFEFLGQPRTFYSIISERHHQLSTKLKVGVMWDHNGTYMEGYGFRYRDHSITVELTPEDELAGALSPCLGNEPSCACKIRKEICSCFSSDCVFYHLLSALSHQMSLCTLQSAARSLRYMVNSSALREVHSALSHARHAQRWCWDLE